MQLRTFLQRFTRKERRITLPTMLTIFRFLLTPFIVAAMVYQQWGIAFWLFLLAAITDLLDGFLARILDQKTFLGACLDPVADKLLILAVFFTLAFVQSPLFAIPTWFVAIVLVKELVLIVGAALIYLICGSIEIRPTLLGKATMCVQVFFVIWLFACYFFNWLPITTYWVALTVVLGMVILSLLQYGALGVAQLVACFERE